MLFCVLQGGRCTYCSSVKESKVIAKPKGWEWAYEGKKPNATQILLNFIAHGPLTVSLQVGGKAWSKFNFLK